MKTGSLSLVLLAASVLSANAQKFVTFKEAADPVPVSQRSQVAWNTVGKVQAQWVSAEPLLVSLAFV